jgi:hypothetical protein
LPNWRAYRLVGFFRPRIKNAGGVQVPDASMARQVPSFRLDDSLRAHAHIPIGLLLISRRTSIEPVALYSETEDRVGSVGADSSPVIYSPPRRSRQPQFVATLQAGELGMTSVPATPIGDVRRLMSRFRAVAIYQITFSVPGATLPLSIRRSLGSVVMAMQTVDHLIELWRCEQPRRRRRPGCSGPRYCDRPLRRWARQTAAQTEY